MRKEISESEGEAGFLYGFFTLSFFLRECLKKGILKYYRKIAPRDKALSLSLSTFFPPFLLDFCVLLDNASEDVGYQQIAIIPAFCLVFEIRFTGNTFD